MTQSDFALLMGGNEVLSVILRSLLPPGAVADFVDDAIRDLAKFDRIAHNRLWIPETGANFLTFDTRAPLVLTPDAGVDVYFVEPGTDVRTVTSSGSDGVLHHRRVSLAQGVFGKTTHVVEVPDALRGRMVSLVLANTGLESAAHDFSLAPPEGAEYDDIRASLAVSARPEALVAQSISQIYLLDNIALAATRPGEGEALQIAAGSGEVLPIGPEAALPLVQAALAAWAGTGLLSAGQIATLAELELEVANLDGSLLALAHGGRITLDATAAGHGWFLDPTPATSVEFTGATVDGHKVALDGIAAGAIDLLTVLTHEMGHLIGLADVPRAAGPERMMTDVIQPGIRRVITPADIAALAALPRLPEAAPAPEALGAAPINTGFVNGDFAGGLAGWTLSGDVAATPDGARLSEAGAGAFTGLSQGFLVPDGATRIRLNLSDIVLGQDPGRAPDALEVSLFDYATGAAVRSLHDLAGTDALVSIQRDGTIRFGAGVEAEGLSSGDRIADLSAPLTLTLSLGGVAAGAALRLGVDLIGFGATDAGVTIRGVALDTDNRAPVAAPFAVQTDRETPVVFDPRLNDFDPDGDPLIIEVITGPANGALDPALGGGLRYTPAPGFVGADSFSYRVSDGFVSSNVVEVAITVNQVNDAPAIAPLAPVTLDEGEALRLTPVATDPDGPGPITWRLVSGPAGMTVDAATGEIIWAAPDGPAMYQAVIAAADAAGAESQATLDITVRDVPPTIGLFGSAATRVNETYALTFSITDPGQDTISAISIDWGDGSDPVAIDPEARRAEHVFTAIGQRQIVLRVTDENGTFEADPFGVNVQPATNLSQLVRTAGLNVGSQGVEVLLTRAIDPASLTPASVELRDDAGALVGGSASLSDDGRRVIFAADDVLRTGDYSLRLSGGPNGANPPPPGALLAAVGGAALDGDADGVAGGDAVLSFRVAAGMTRPVANPVDTATVEGRPVRIDVLANDIDPGGDTLMPVVQAAPANGSVEINPDGTVTYRPEAGFIGEDAFFYSATDGEALSEAVRVRINVLPLQPPPPGGGGAGSGGSGVVGGTTGGGAARPAGLPADAAAMPGGGAPAVPGAATPDVEADTSVRDIIEPRPMLVSSFGTPGRLGTLRCEARTDADMAGLRVGLPARAATGQGIVMMLAELRPGAMVALQSWQVDWGDDTTSEGTREDLPVHVFDEGGVYLVQVRFVTESGIFTTQLIVQVGGSAALDVIAVRNGARSVEITFSRPIAEPGTPVDGIALRGPDGREIAGILRLEGEGERLVFVPDEAPLAPGSYRLVLNAPFDELADLLACTGAEGALGLPGGSFVVQFDVDGAVARAPDAGLPLFAQGLGGVTALLLRLALPEGLAATLSPGADLPDDARLVMDAEQDEARLTLPDGAALPDGPLEIARLHLRGIDNAPDAQITAGMHLELEVTARADSPALVLGAATPVAVLALAGARAGSRQRAGTGAFENGLAAIVGQVQAGQADDEWRASFVSGVAAAAPLVGGLNRRYRLSED